ncbi:MAG: hypothetical protein WDZ81_01065, partial [Candidatus Saccharimonadales bacterium]
DTFFVPEVGEPLVLPEAEILEDAGPEEVKKWLKERKYLLFHPGDHYSDDDVDRRIEQLQEKFRVDGAIHLNLPHSRLEAEMGKAIQQERLTRQVVSLLPQVGPHSRRRAVARGILSGTQEPAPKWDTGPAF